MELFKFIWKVERYNFIPCYRSKVLESPVFHVKNHGSTFLKLYPKEDVSDPVHDLLIIDLKYCTKFNHLAISCDVELVEKGVRTKYIVEKVYDNTKWKFRADKSPILYINIENGRVLNKGSFNIYSSADLIVTCCFYEKSDRNLYMTEELSVFSEDFKKMYEKRQFCDLILRAGTEEFYVHKAIIFARIPKLYAHLMQKTKTDDEKKVLTKATLDMEPSVLRVLLDYVYSGKVDSTESVVPTGLYTVAESYEMVDLKEKLHTSPSKITALTCVKMDYNVFRWHFSNLHDLEVRHRMYSPSFSGGAVPCSDLKMECYIIKSVIPFSFYNEDRLKVIFHRLYKGDPIYVRCKLTIEELPFLKHIGEHVFDTDEKWEFPTFFGFDRKKPLIRIGTNSTGLKGFTLRCEYSISADERAFIEGTECTAAPFENFAAQSNNVINLSDDLTSLYNIFRPMMTDITIQINNVKFPAHKFILAARSPVFARMFEHDMLETVKGIINISDIDVATLNLLLHYLYSGKVHTLNFDSAVKLYGASHKYEVTSLKKFCVQYLKEILSSNNVSDILILADMYCDTNLKKVAMDFTFAHSDVISRLSE
ncbi:speckle-type POZ protein-like A [Trichonephila inaurata madagascariensis]|uniref:Speckle-type POZ protein-like A n=1 Tax=Trichonephila inaurata madagascariensis TaxID=2747483 RepID=A0A8X6WVP8_9ARAC|nr:speckle-type POZ protein-like A [Trichonephila inaurata madagascariensis]